VRVRARAYVCACARVCAGVLDEELRASIAEQVSQTRQHGAAGVVGVKLGIRGAVLSPSAGEILEIPCLPAPGSVVDTTGAGDSFLAGLVAGILRGMPIREAGLLGAATAACCVTGVGATAGLRSFEDTLRLAEAHRR